MVPRLESALGHGTSRGSLTQGRLGYTPELLGLHATPLIIFFWHCFPIVPPTDVDLSFGALL